MEALDLLEQDTQDTAIVSVVIILNIDLKNFFTIYIIWTLINKHISAYKNSLGHIFSFAKIILLSRFIAMIYYILENILTLNRWN